MCFLIYYFFLFLRTLGRCATYARPWAPLPLHWTSASNGTNPCCMTSCRPLCGSCPSIVCLCLTGEQCLSCVDLCCGICWIPLGHGKASISQNTQKLFWFACVVLQKFSLLIFPDCWTRCVCGGNSVRDRMKQTLGYTKTTPIHLNHEDRPCLVPPNLFANYNGVCADNSFACSQQHAVQQSCPLDVTCSHHSTQTQSMYLSQIENLHSYYEVSMQGLQSIRPARNLST